MVVQVHDCVCLRRPSGLGGLVVLAGGVCLHIVVGVVALHRGIVVVFV